MRFWTFTSLLVFLTCVFSCGRDDVPDDPVDNSGISGIRLDKTEFNGLEVVMVSSDALFHNNTFEGKVGEKSVQLNRISNSALGFTMPNLETGNYSFSVEGFNESISISITKTEEVTTPDNVISDFLGDYESEFDKLVTHTEELATKGAVQNLESEKMELLAAKDTIALALEKFAALSTDEKQAVAQFIKANQANIRELDLILDGVYKEGGFKKGACDYTEDWDKAQCLIKEMVKGIAYMGAPAAIGGIIGGELTGGLGTVPGALVATWLCKSKVIAGRKRFRNAFAELVTWAFIPVDNVEAELEARKKVETFTNGELREISFSFATRTINELRDADNDKLSNFFLVLKGFNFISRELLKRPTFSIPGERKGVYIPKDLENLEMTISDNGLVAGELQIKDGQIYAVFSTNEKEAQSFKFNLSFAYGEQIIESVWLDAEVENAIIYTIEFVSSYAGDVQVHNTFKSGDPFEVMNGLNHYFRVYQDGIMIQDVAGWRHSGVDYNKGTNVYVGATSISAGTVSFPADVTVNTSAYNSMANRTVSCYYVRVTKPETPKVLKFNDDFTCDVSYKGESQGSFTWSFVLGANAPVYVHNEEEGRVPKKRAALINCHNQSGWTGIPEYIDVYADGSIRATGTRGITTKSTHWVLE